MKRIVVPLGAGVASALGFLVAPPATDMVRSYVARLERLDWDHGQCAVRRDGRGRLARCSAKPAPIRPASRCEPTADMRHVGQGFEIPVPLPSTHARRRRSCRRSARPSSPATASASAASSKDSPIEALSWRLACVAPGQDIRIRAGRHADGGTPAAARARHARGAVRRRWVRCPARSMTATRWRPARRFDGPALVEERESTCCIGPDARVSVDQFLNLVIELP